MEDEDQEETWQEFYEENRFIPPHQSRSPDSAEFQVHATFYDAANHWFFGSTWKGPFMASSDVITGKAKVSLNEPLYFHTSQNDYTTLVVIEIAVTAVCLTRAQRRGATPMITSSASAAKKDNRFRPLQPATSVLDQQQQISMLVEALIGLEITGIVAQVFMIWWDRMFTSRLSELGIIERLRKRYIDDINMAIDELPAGTRYTDGRLFIDEMAIEGDLQVAGDKRTMEVIKRVGNSIHTSIQLEVDCPSNHDDGKMPFLDSKLYLNDVAGTKKIVHEFYVKVVSTKAMVNTDSALAMRQKRTVLTQEVLRSTPRAELRRKLQTEIDRSDVRIRVVETAGQPVKRKLQRSDPFKAATCNGEGCLSKAEKGNITVNSQRMDIRGGNNVWKNLSEEQNLQLFGDIARSGTTVKFKTSK
eukprot:gene15095-16652_t